MLTELEYQVATPTRILNCLTVKGLCSVKSARCQTVSTQTTFPLKEQIS